MSGATTSRQVLGPLAAAPKPVRLGSGIRTTTDRQDGRDVVWHESKRAWAALLDVAGVRLRVTIQKLHPSSYRPGLHPGGQPRPDVPRYRVLVDGVFVQPDWGFRRGLREAKADGVRFAVAVGTETAAARKAHRAGEERAA